MMDHAFEFSSSYCYVEMYICGLTGSQKAVLLLVFEYTDYDMQLIWLLIKTPIMYLYADVPRRKKATVEIALDFVTPHILFCMLPLYFHVSILNIPYAATMG